MSVFINELHYDNDGEDVGEFFEIAGPAGTDLSGWSVVLYNGNGAAPYDTVLLSGSLGDAGQGLGFAAFGLPTNGIQNGAPDGLALVDPSNAVVEFLSYEGVMTAVGGPADGLTSTDIGVSESGATPAGFSLQRAGTGTEAADFTFAEAQEATPDAVNAGQTIEAPGAFDLQVTEIWPGNDPGSNLTADWFEVTNVGDAAWTIADGALFYDDDSLDAGAADPLSGVVEIAPGESVVFVNDSTTDEFVAVWGGVIELGQVGTFDGSGLSQGGDGVTLFLDAAGDGDLLTGLSLALSAPLDALYAACSIAEKALDATVSRLGGEPVRDGAFDELVAGLRAELDEERNPALLALRIAAHGRGLSFLRDQLLFADLVEGPQRDDPLVPVSPETTERQAANAAIECINCAVCYSACDVVGWRDDYLGPAALNRAWAAWNDVRDGNRTGVLKAVSASGGCHNCHSHQSCAEHCPVELNPTAAIAGLKRATTRALLKGELK